MYPKFKAVYQLKNIGEFSTLKEAFKAIYDEIKAAFDLDTPVFWQTLEAATWIVSSQIPIMFPEARDRMCREGHLVNNKWVD